MKTMILIINLIVMMSGAISATPHNYKMTGIISNIDEVVDERGETWNYTELSNVGTKVIITFNNQGTRDAIEDDVIVKIEEVR